jgi:hypothetical protein
MKRSLIASGLVGVFALACSAAAALAQPDNIGGSQQQLLSPATSPLVLVRGGGGGHGGGGHGFGGGHGGHGFHGGHFHGSFGAFGSPYYNDDYGEPGSAGGAHALTDGSVTDGYPAAPRGRSQEGVTTY